ncbi:MAG: hypothetical protein HY644_04325 [Acidobacteria bacterium]|nr:hypothetical protein [Acidobacteriota bacterium]
MGEKFTQVPGSQTSQLNQPALGAKDEGVDCLNHVNDFLRSAGATKTFCFFTKVSPV